MSIIVEQWMAKLAIVEKFEKAEDTTQTNRTMSPKDRTNRPDNTIQKLPDMLPQILFHGIIRAVISTSMEHRSNSEIIFS